MINDIERVFFTEEEIRSAVAKLGAEISRDYAGKDPLFVGVLKGSWIFMADLMRYVTIPCSVEFMAVKSYSGTKTTGVVQIQKDLNVPVEGRHIVMVEDILDTGKTLNYLMNFLSDRGAASIKIATLMDKPARRMAPVEASYSCFEVPDEFVVGYGLDYNEFYRNLPYIGVLKPEIYSK